jgi:hypothetical protein
MLRKVYRARAAGATWSVKGENPLGMVSARELSQKEIFADGVESRLIPPILDFLGAQSQMGCVQA